MADLETRRLGRTEMRPKALGLGGAWLHNGPERETIEAIHRAIELGMDYLDTYPGHEEHRWGKALEGGLREKVYLQAKVGPHPERRKDFSADATRWSVENSLKQFKTDYLDAVLIHDPIDIEDPLAPGRALDELLKMKAEGVVRHIGLGVRSHEFHRRAIETGQIDLVLTFLDYNLLNQSVAQTTLPLAREHDVGIILASPLGMGLLTGVEPDPDTERRRSPETEPRAHAMWHWCQNRGVNIRHLALQFCLAAHIDGIVMVGPANKQQVEEAYEAATAEVPPEIWREFEAEFGVRPTNLEKLIV
ncbi:MAG: aldo/keto reductase [Candidatus Poribacteria bacterium]|nr:aldo/keto reductase [Candidatus Poribacteria bacterium]